MPNSARVASTIALHGVGVRDVAGDGEAAAALVAHEAGGLVDLALRARGGDDVGAGVGERDGHRAAEAAAGAGDDGDAAVEAELIENAHQHRSRHRFAFVRSCVTHRF